MAKDKNNRAFQAIEKVAIPLFEDGKKAFEIYPACMELVTDGTVQFREIVPTVDSIGRDKGYILSLDQKKEKVAGLWSEWLETDGNELENLDYENFVELCIELGDNQELTEKQGQAVGKDFFKASGVEVPKKERVQDWQKDLAEKFYHNPLMSRDECYTILKGYLKNNETQGSIVYPVLSIIGRRIYDLQKID